MRINFSLFQLLIILILKQDIKTRRAPTPSAYQEHYLSFLSSSSTTSLPPPLSQFLPYSRTSRGSCPTAHTHPGSENKTQQIL